MEYPWRYRQFSLPWPHGRLFVPCMAGGSPYWHHNTANVITLERFVQKLYYKVTFGVIGCPTHGISLKVQAIEYSMTPWNIVCALYGWWKSSLTSQHCQCVHFGEVCTESLLQSDFWCYRLSHTWNIIEGTGNAVFHDPREDCLYLVWLVKVLIDITTLPKCSLWRGLYRISTTKWLLVL